jgi:YD repeat-containing protein
MHYTYDPAHRLIAIADSLGNQTRYTLDALGNRTRDDVLDPAAQLTQLRRRGFDALGQSGSRTSARATSSPPTRMTPMATAARSATP